MIAEFISVGTELLLGNIVNTNAAYLSRRCADLGITVYHQITVGDNEERLSQALEAALKRSDLIILTGGLGPTEDDLTKETVAKYLGLNMITDIQTQEHLKEYFARMGKDISSNNWKQAKVMEGSMVLHNDNGTAPGIIVMTKDEKRIVMLPGPENEMNPMFEKYVAPYVREISPETIYSRVIKLCGIGEGKVAETINDLIKQQTNPTIATYAKTGETHIRVTAKAADIEEAKKIIKPTLKELKNRFEENIYSVDENETMEDVIVQMLKKYDLTLTTAESCTGGMIASRIVNVSGVSEVLKEGFVTYSNKAKRKYLDVNKVTLKKYGAVSEQTAKEMAKGAAITTDCDAAIAVTGIAGPDGGTDELPVGTVYVGIYVNEKVVIKRFAFQGDRMKIRELTTINALDLLRRCLLENYKNETCNL